MDEDTFQFLREDKFCGFQLLKRQEEITDNEKQYGGYRFSNEPELILKDHGSYYIARNWEINNIDNLIDKIETQFPEIQFSKNRHLKK